MSEGCHPRPRINFPSALPLGEAGWDEVLEVDFYGDGTVDTIRAALARVAPAGLGVTHVEELSPASRAATGREFAYEVPVPEDRQTDTADRVVRLLARPTLPVGRRDRPAVDLRDLLVTAEVANGLLRFRVRASRDRGLRARDVQAFLGLDNLDDQDLHATRSQVVLEP